MPQRNPDSLTAQWAAEFAFNPAEWRPDAYKRTGFHHKKGNPCFRRYRNGKPTSETMERLPEGYRVQEDRIMHEDQIHEVHVPRAGLQEPDEYASGDPGRVIRAADLLFPRPLWESHNPAEKRRGDRLARLALLGMARLHEQRMPQEVKDFLPQAERLADNPDTIFHPDYLASLRGRHEGTPGFGRIHKAVSSIVPPGMSLHMAADALSPDAYNSDEPELQASSARHADVLRSVYYHGKGVKIPTNRAIFQLARTAYRDSDPIAMLALADALEEKGDAPPEVLANLRNPHSAVRGNWVIDHILGKR